MEDVKKTTEYKKLLAEKKALTKDIEKLESVKKGIEESHAKIIMEYKIAMDDCEEAVARFDELEREYSTLVSQYEDAVSRSVKNTIQALNLKPIMSDGEAFAAFDKFFEYMKKHRLVFDVRAHRHMGRVIHFLSGVRQEFDKASEKAGS